MHFNSYTTESGAKIALWKSKELLKESIKAPSTTDTSLYPEITTQHDQKRVKFKGICVRQGSISFIQGNVVNLYISYKLDTLSRGLNIGFTLLNCLFGAVKLTKNDDPDNYGYNGYGIGFDSCSKSKFSWGGEWGKNVVIFGLDNSSSVLVDSRKKKVSSW